MWETRPSFAGNAKKPKRKGNEQTPKIRINFKQEGASLERKGDLRKVLTLREM